MSSASLVVLRPKHWQISVADLVRGLPGVGAEHQAPPVYARARDREAGTQANDKGMSVTWNPDASAPSAAAAPGLAGAAGWRRGWRSRHLCRGGNLFHWCGDLLTHCCGRKLWRVLWCVLLTLLGSWFGGKQGRRVDPGSARSSRWVFVFSQMVRLQR